MIFIPTEYPTVFLSFDEPNCETNYKRLLEVCPTAKRVHGIEGSDAAHKAVSQLVDSTHVIIVDGDNFVNDDFYHSSFELDDSADFNNKVLSFSGKNIINGLQYGNGGIKVWPVHLLESMKTHENADTEQTLVDFDCTNYLQLNTAGSTLLINGSPLQAWRSGYREGIKLCLDDGMYQRKLVDIDWRNLNKLWNWMHIGKDVTNGLWAIYGARLGCWQALLRMDLSKLHNFTHTNDLFFDMIGSNPLVKSEQTLISECNRIGELICAETSTDLVQDIYTDDESRIYRETVAPILRSPETFLANKPKVEYDIVFISYMEENADKNYNKLLARFPRAKRVHGIKGIHNAHIEAAKHCTTDYFWVVDADAEILDTFMFDHDIFFYDKLKVRVWRSINPVNDLVYGYGGVKLLPRISTIHMKKEKPDMTTSICKYYEPIMVVSNVTVFNTDEFNTWRSAFRECAKLASQVIDNQNDSETMQRLDTWCTEGADKLFGEYAIHGAKTGRTYGIKYSGDLESLRKINDFEWMREQFDKFY